jgi:thioredoxin 1
LTSKMIRDITTSAELEHAYQDSIKHNSLLMIQIHTDWCGYCIRMKSAIERLAQEYPQSTIVRVNGDKAPEITSKMKIDGVPLFFFFKHGDGIAKVAGADTQQIEELFKANA